MKYHYTPEEMDTFAIEDLLNDATNSEDQAANGPFYPDRGITKESCLAYAAKCRAQATQYKNGGAHNAVIHGRN